MTATEHPMDVGVCEQCGQGTHQNHEGKTACDGCDKPTMMCKCAPSPHAPDAP
jgi:hypothetical protein